jgi:polar amino acid transport system substrate-binding protein
MDVSVRGSRTWLAMVATGVIALATAACSGGTSSSTTSTSVTNDTVVYPVPSEVIPPQVPVASIAATVPAAVRAKSSFVIAVGTGLPPNGFVAPGKATLVGMDVDIAVAAAQVMGLKPMVEKAPAGSVLSGLGAGTYAMAASSLPDSRAGEQLVDYVDYFLSGQAYFVKKNSKLGFNGIAAVCGQSVGVVAGTLSAAEARAQAVRCRTEKTSPAHITSYGSLSALVGAVSSGKVGAGLTTSPVAGYIVSARSGQLELSGSPFNLAPYGLALPKGNGMAGPTAAAVDVLIGDGVYNHILAKWGTQAGAVTKASVNSGGRVLNPA